MAPPRPVNYSVQIRGDGRAYVIAPNGRAARNHAGRVLALHDPRTARELASRLTKAGA